ncbi:uncharacterized protein LOC135195855 [Macrobrachium nipponense]|uniref:uncharacterized protein LOC135195855 n=1 Tax=Macrobrachium nipponense TaxID=159736 RepID=UPI0030C89176
MANGLVEKFNGTLKSMIKKMCAEQPTTWDRYLPAVLFAYRESPQASMGFSPFELLYGRTVRGPLAILRDLWDKERNEEEVRTTYDYVFQPPRKIRRNLNKSSVEVRESGGTIAVVEEDPQEDFSPLLVPDTGPSPTWEQTNLNKELQENQKQNLEALLSRYRAVMSEIPGRTHVIKHQIRFRGDLTKKNQPNDLLWEEMHDRAFVSLKNKIAAEPILLLPDLQAEFVLRTDASNAGLGAILLQEVDGVKRPIAYESRKLLPRETKYAAVEKECLAIVWGIQKFAVYLYGRYFVLETDHKPLAYLRLLEN